MPTLLIQYLLFVIIKVVPGIVNDTCTSSRSIFVVSLADHASPPLLFHVRPTILEFSPEMLWDSVGLPYGITAIKVAQGTLHGEEPEGGGRVERH